MSKLHVTGVLPRRSVACHILPPPIKHPAGHYESEVEELALARGAAPTILELSTKVRLLRAHSANVIAEQKRIDNRLGELYLRLGAMKNDHELLRIGLTYRMDNLDARVGLLLQGLL